MTTNRNFKRTYLKNSLASVVAKIEFCFSGVLSFEVPLQQSCKKNTKGKISGKYQGDHIPSERFTNKCYEWSYIRSTGSNRNKPLSYDFF